MRASSRTAFSKGGNIPGIRRATNTCRRKPRATSAPLLLSLMAFGNKHFAPEGAMVEVVNTTTGKPADIGVYDRATGLPIVAPEYRMVPGPAANARVKKRYAARKVEAGAA